MSAPQDCRMYEAKFPEVEDVVMVEVTSIAEMGAYVKLLEYGNIEGMILMSELSRRRIRSITRLIKVGRQEPVMVLRVEKDKGYIDLSKRRVSPEDIASCEQKYTKSKMVHSIMRHSAENQHVDIEKLYSAIGWPLYKLYGHAYDAFKLMVQDPAAVWKRLEEGYPDSAPYLTDEVKEAVLKNVGRRMTPQPFKIRADVEMTCYAYDGVLHIKDAMRAAQRCSSDKCPVKVKLVAPPLYVLSTQTLEKEEGIEVLNQSVQALTESIAGQGGKVVVKEAARAVSERDDRMLTEQMQALEARDEDEEEEEEEEGMGDFDIEAPAAVSA